MLAAALVVATLASRLPFTSQYLFGWDSANFALAMDDYNVTWQRPHPPGYPLYVAAAWLVRPFARDANASLVALSVVASTIAVVCVAGLAWRLQSPTHAGIAGALYVASPLAWGHGEVAYPYAFLGLFSALIAWLALDARVGRKDRTLVGAAALAVGGGFRPDLLPFLLPIWLWGTWPRGTRAILRGLVVILLGCIAWFVPMVVLSGGWGPYWEQSSAFSEAWAVPLSSPGAFGQGVRTNLRAFLDAAARTVTPLMAAAILYVCFATLALRRRWPTHAPWLLLLWLAVPLPAYVFVHLGKSGYLLTLLPAAVIVASAGIVVGAEDLARLLRRPHLSRPVTVALALATCAWNAAIFLLAPGPVSLSEIRAVDAELRGTIDLARALPLDTTAIVSFDRYRQLEYYLPDYASGGHLFAGLELAGPQAGRPSAEIDVPLGVTDVVFPDLYENASAGTRGVEAVPVNPDVVAWIVHLEPGGRVAFGTTFARPAETIVGH